MILESSSIPFPHAVVDGYWLDDLLRKVRSEIPDPNDGGFTHFHNEKEEKFEGGPAVWGLATNQLAEALCTPEFILWLERLMNIEGLRCEFVGGGYHVIPPGGKLAIHADFNRHPFSNWHRRLNLLIYLNDAWQDEEGGHLELWGEGKMAKKILPALNTMVIFETSSSSYHGHPHPLPAQRPRCSFAAYYYTEMPPANWDGENHSTVFHA